MADKSNISWTDATWNPTTGCSHVSPGCEHCYAETLSLRRGWSKKPWTKPNAAENVILHPDRLDLPLRWKEPRRVFVDSMSDLFHEQIPDDFIAAVFAVMAVSSRHIFQVLTKRPERMLAWFARLESWTDQSREIFGADTESWRRWTNLMSAFGGHTGSGRLSSGASGPTPWPLPNVWLGVSVEDQRRAEERIPLLLETPAAVRFLSCEPLLGPVDLTAVDPIPLKYRDVLDPPVRLNALTGHVAGPDEMLDAKIDWIIVGGESGPGPDDRRLVRRCGWCGNGADSSRCQECHGQIWLPTDTGLAWARSLRDQCTAAGAAFFFKQWGGPRPTSGGDLLDGRLWHEFPVVAPQ